MSRLLSVWSRNLGRIELHLTPDIVAFAPNGGCSALLYGANEQLSGPQFTPSEANARLAGNSIRGRGLIYPEQTVDGQVSENGGLALRRILSALPTHGSPPIRCAPGSAVATVAVGLLSQNFSVLLHACPPDFACSTPGSVDRSRVLLRSCYLRAFDLAWRRESGVHMDCSSPALSSIATPLLGAGARGFSLAQAAEVLADAVREWPLSQIQLPGPQASRLLCIAVQDEDAAEAVTSAISSSNP